MTKPIFGLYLHQRRCSVLLSTQPSQSFQCALNGVGGRSFPYEQQGLFTDEEDDQAYIINACCQFKVVGFDTVRLIFEPCCEKSGLRGFRSGPTLTGLYSHKRWLEA